MDPEESRMDGFLPSSPIWILESAFCIVSACYLILDGTKEPLELRPVKSPFSDRGSLGSGLVFMMPVKIMGGAHCLRRVSRWRD
ncbi:hypothetical protein BO94DRAFT_535350 [Aspergillus sclerotioniger CBS 115572]|uniref:Uncharacterized protein n=1 Tax=Aspergillus sclerotioniger CBS 115572 TaxID=1450535 RepID=A0A317WLH3_9EURO|nr:hypothetical protein BO94DRAFT_535350 [Aspergillus sclerotioniger CBS 115572]PWY87243.1 hypothetical protein BO94DRAFT_535350 [Aspergillus sclerotioniger CBS 115572]